MYGNRSMRDRDGCMGAMRDGGASMGAITGVRYLRMGRADKPVLPRARPSAWSELVVMGIGRSAGEDVQALAAHRKGFTASDAQPRKSQTGCARRKRKMARDLREQLSFGFNVIRRPGGGDRDG